MLLGSVGFFTTTGRNAMKSILKFTTSGLGALALAGLLAGCDTKSDDTTATPSAVASSAPSAAPDTAVATAGADDAASREHDRAMSDDMAERHRQDMDHDAMRRGPMGPMGPGATPSPTGSQPAQQPMQDM